MGGVGFLEGVNVQNFRVGRLLFEKKGRRREKKKIIEYWVLNVLNYFYVIFFGMKQLLKIVLFNFCKIYIVFMFWVGRDE